MHTVIHKYTVIHKHTNTQKYANTLTFSWHKSTLQSTGLHLSDFSQKSFLRDEDILHCTLVPTRMTKEIDLMSTSVQYFTELFVKCGGRESASKIIQSAAAAANTGPSFFNHNGQQ